MIVLINFYTKFNKHGRGRSLAKHHYQLY